MEYSLIQIETIPTLDFAHSYSTEKYNMHFSPSPSFIEITMIERGDVLRRDGYGNMILVPSGSVHIRMAEFCGTMNTVEGIHSHSTVGIRMSYKSRPIAAEEPIAVCADIEGCKNPNELLLPIFLPQGKYSSIIEGYIKNVIHTKLAGQAGSSLKAAGLCLELLAAISKDCVNEILHAGQRTVLSPSAILYCKKAMDFIATNYSHKLSVAEIAERFGITPNYLSNIFKNYTGKSVMRYVTGVRLKIVEELLSNHKATLAQAGRLVGIEDANYLSRIFHKHYGNSARTMLKTK